MWVPSDSGNDLEPLELLSRLLAAGETRVAAEAVGGRAAPAVAALIRAGLLVPSGVIASIVCDVCSEFHLAEVVLDSERDQFGWRCSEMGFVKADDEAVAALSLGMQPSAAALERTFSARYGARRRTTRSLDGDDAWLVGAWEVDGAWTTVALVRRIEATGTARRIRRAIADLPPNQAGLVLTIGEGSEFEPPPRFRAVPLTTAVFLNADGGLSIDAAVVRRVVAIAGDSHAGRPTLELNVFSLLDELQARGSPTTGRGLAAHVGRLWSTYYPDAACPQPSTLRKHVNTWRSRP